MPAALTMVMALTFGTTVEGTTEGDVNLVSLIDRVTRQTTFKSLHMRVEILQSKSKTLPPERGREVKYELEYAATSLGRRYYDYKYTIVPDGRVFHLTSYTDGRKCANVEYDPKNHTRQATIAIDHHFMDETKTGFSQCPAPLRYY